MRDRDLYAAILGLTAPWKVTDVDLDTSTETVSVKVAADGKLADKCPECGAACPRHDTRERRWRHLDTCQFQTVLVASIPRVKCAEHGVHQVQAPWSEPGSRFTALLEALVIDWLKEATTAAVARRLRLSWDEVDGIMQRAVARGLLRRPALKLHGIGVDETSFAKRHEYVTVVADLASNDVVYVADGRKKGALNGFYKSLSSEQIDSISFVAMDMSKSYIASTLQHVPDAESKICFDRFHVAKLLGDALDKVRRDEHRALRAEGDASLTGTKHLLLRRGDTLSPQDEGVVDILRRMSLKSARAWAIKEAATKLWHYVRKGWAEKAWKKWISWAVRSRLEPIKKAARTIRNHLWGIVNAVVHSVSNARLESINARIQRVKKAACGFRNRERFRAAIMFHLGGLDLYPRPLAHTEA